MERIITNYALRITHYELRIINQAKTPSQNLKS